MNVTLKQRLKAVATAIAKLGGSPVPDADIPDAAGLCRKAERDLAGWRQGLTSELPSGTHKGGEYQVVVPRVSHRNYNPQAIIADVASRDQVSPISALLALIDEGAARLEFVWTELERAYSTRQIDMRIANRELTAGDQHLDGPHVGCYWTDGTPRVEAAGKEPFKRTAKP